MPVAIAAKVVTRAGTILQRIDQNIQYKLDWSDADCERERLE